MKKVLEILKQLLIQLLCKDKVIEEQPNNLGWYDNDRLIIFNKKVCDTKPHFPFINQWNEKETRMYCTLYAPFIALDYNSNISNKLWEKEKDIEKIIKKLANKEKKEWILSSKWATGKSWVLTIANHFKANVIELHKDYDSNSNQRLLGNYH